MDNEKKAAYLIGVNHRIQYTDSTCGPELCEDIRKFEDYLVGEATQLDVDFLAEEFSEEVLRMNSASACTVRNAALRSQKRHLFCDPDKAERAAANITNFEQREEFWLACLERVKAERLLMICGDDHVESFKIHLEAAGFTVSILSSKCWGSNWFFRDCTM
jgi:hypothetical protein